MSPDDLNKILFYSLSGIAYAFAIPFFYIAIFKSPSSLRVYRNTLLNLAIWYCIAMGTYSILFQPMYTAFETKSCARIDGLISHFRLEFQITVMFLSVISMENLALTMLICFFYRYEQMRPVNSGRFLHSWKGLLICLVMHVTISIFAGCFFYVFLRNGEIIELNGKFLFCADDRNYDIVKKLSLFVIFLFIVQAFAGLTLAVMTIKRMRCQKALMTMQTYRLQQRLTINLVVLTVLPILFDVIPICILCFMIYVKADSLYLWVSLVGHTPIADLILTFVVTLLFVTPYREAVKRMLRMTNVVTPAISFH
ncbi:hypothetical protein QR680_015456 [Steinernema hermaphroditum]|uniref:Uncharacterized protein n=1 Tax=Steinernema hermaphroditum TaxID=289476 RepID=A0AA39HAB5_9BILA|nr:hypothetical protein QR680_015456 [Steinernema hermaphroditum]